MNRHPQHDNLIIAANDKDAFFKNEIYGIHHIDTVLTFSENSWTYVKPYKYQHVKDAWEKDKSLVVEYKSFDYMEWSFAGQPTWDESYIYRIKPKTITKRLYASKDGEVLLLSSAACGYTIPINGTDTEVECE